MATIRVRAVAERPRWQARIEIAGETLGAGILVDPTRVLTCAHIVDGRTDVQVTFPDAARCQDLPALVMFRGAWRRPNDTGDVAVLELRQPVGFAPATFADPSMRHGHERRELSVYGFREGNELQPGFGGAAAYDPDTGIVYGMITEADPDRPMGRMLPVSSIRRHWEELDDLLMLDWLGVTERRALREIVRGATADVPVAQVLAAVPGPADPPPFASVWDAIRFVGEECHGDLRLTRFLGALEQHLSADIAGRLRAWRRHTLPDAGNVAGVARQPAMTSIIVTVDRTRAADGYRLTFATLVAGIPTPRGGPVEVRGAGQVRRAVELAIHDLIGAVAGRRPVIEFVLPESWLSKPVDEWRAGSVLMSTYPVVVRDVQRLRPGVRQDQVLARWAELDGRAESKPERIRCRYEHTKDQFAAWLTENDALCVLAYAAQPRRDRLRVALNHGIPVMLWPRTQCSGPDHGGCPGDRFLDELADGIADVPPEELPERVKKLRARARQLPDHEAHCGRKLTLLWDDPRRHPDRPLYMET